ncbi:MAG: hypothetical protein PHW33_01255 [Candidatus Portnoybacteria bacterium]|jgi:CxxC-x17-CxxC domain-containing protein|nr:hypothetical protein [Candidatus Portnoybacteria bacterium]
MAFQRNFGGGQRFQRDDRPRQTFQGDWKCSECGTPITELPFQPSGDRPIFCRDCYRKQRNDRFGR